MRFIILLIMLCITTPALARHHHHAHHHIHHHITAVPGHMTSQVGGKHNLFLCPHCIIRTTFAGAVSVSVANADRLVAVINELYQVGYRGPVDCASNARSHVRHSKHFTGDACDFDQCGWGCAPSIMHTALARRIIEAHGLTDGCDFGDCGHVGTDGQGTHHHGGRYAYHHHGGSTHGHHRPARSHRLA